MKKIRKECDENSTEYGEFVCSAYHWLPIEKKKKQARKLENITNNKEKNK